MLHQGDVARGEPSAAPGQQHAKVADQCERIRVRVAESVSRPPASTSRSGGSAPVRSPRACSSICQHARLLIDLSVLGCVSPSVVRIAARLAPRGAAAQLPPGRPELATANQGAVDRADVSVPTRVPFAQPYASSLHTLIEQATRCCRAAYLEQHAHLLQQASNCTPPPGLDAVQYPHTFPVSWLQGRGSLAGLDVRCVSFYRAIYLSVSYAFPATLIFKDPPQQKRNVNTPL